MNENKSEQIKIHFLSLGYLYDEIDYDLVIFNTCCIRDTAEQKIMSHIAVEKQKNKKILISGCLSQKLKNRFEIFNINNLLTKNKFIDITYGCDNHCSYCIVPSVRGHLRIRGEEEILREFVYKIRFNKRIVLLGQNVNEYPDFHKLLQKLCSIDGDFTVNFLSSHPKDFTDDLIRTIAVNKKIEKDLHLPLQSGCDRILELMNRKYTVAHYEMLINKLRRLVPDIHITTDIICGFPTETEEDFNETIAVVKRIKFDACYIFPYSIRSGTRAAAMPQIPFSTRKARATKLINLMRKEKKQLSNN
jgi:tRNA-2-methylthio-N6-dimethylallyladenosine synthase